MTAWLYSAFGNEHLLMPYFLHHYATQVDRLIMFDGGATDDSADMIRACPNAMVVGLDEAPFDHGDSADGAAFASWVYREARDEADWVIWVCVDEFLYAKGMSLRALLSDYRGRGIHIVRALGYQMLADEFPVGDAPMTDLVRLGVRDPLYNKPCVFDPSLDVELAPGGHSLTATPDCEIYQGELKLLHYRYFGEDYLRARNAYNHSLKSRDEISSGHGWHTRPDHVAGMYSAEWYKQIQTIAEAVT